MAVYDTADDVIGPGAGAGPSLFLLPQAASSANRNAAPPWRTATRRRLAPGDIRMTTDGDDTFQRLTGDAALRKQTMGSGPGNLAVRVAVIPDVL